jgi:hypothetical protein
METVDDFIFALSKSEQVIVKQLRDLIFEAEPRIQEKLSYRVPYYFLRRRICFLWPESVMPGRTHKRKIPTVTLGLCYGSSLSNAEGLLISGGRKQVCTIDIHSPSDIVIPKLLDVLHEAILLDEWSERKKSKRNH